MDDIVIEFFATFVIWFLYAGLLFLWIKDGKVRREAVAHAIFAGVISWIIVFLIKRFFPTVRPFVLNHKEVDVLFRPADSAFPSSHTALAFGLAVTIFFHDKKVGVWYLLAALLIGIARVLANVHYPLDIFGGAAVGSFIAVMVEKTHMFQLLVRKK